MRFISIYFFILFIAGFQLNGQFSDDFSDGEINNNPSWDGDIDHFIVNDAAQLQLNAPEAGKSFLYTATDFPDSLRWTIELEMDFSPSSSNALRFYLAIDNIDLVQANGYFLEIGENGSADAIHLYSLENGVSNLEASASMGAMATDPSYANIIIEKFGNNIWRLNAAYNKGEFQGLEFELNLPSMLLPSTGYVGIECYYTSSRIASFYFDDISLQLLLPDTDAPIWSGVNAIGASQFNLAFNEPIEESTTQNLNNYNINELGNPDRVEFESSSPSLISIFYDTSPMQSGIKYQLSVEGINDLEGNVMDKTIFSVCLLEEALPGDLVINEILFDPYPDGEDFVEIYNKSNKFIKIDGLILGNDSKTNDFEVLNTDNFLDLNGYLAISPDIDFLEETYQPIKEANLLKHAIPSMNNESGNISISRFIDGVEESIDSFDYHEDLHFELLTNTEGVSLERLNSIQETNIPENWHSASTASNYATPGYINSQVIQALNPALDLVELESQLFSPNGDGDKDLLIIKYKLPESGFVGNFKIYDSSGFPIKSLVNNELLSAEGFYTWDGLNADNVKADIGMYIISYQLFNTDGDVSEGKLVCVLGDQL